jgi:hypothetical protein
VRDVLIGLLRIRSAFHNTVGVVLWAKVETAYYSRITPISTFSIFGDCFDTKTTYAVPISDVSSCAQQRVTKPLYLAAHDFTSAQKQISPEDVGGG